MSRRPVLFIFYLFIFFFLVGRRGGGRLFVNSKIQVEEKDTKQLSMIALRLLKEAAMQE